MARILSSEILNGRFFRAYYYNIVDYRAWSGVGDLVLDSQTYYGVGDVIYHSDIENSTTGTTTNVDLVLNGLDTDWLANIQLDNYIAKNVDIGVVYFSATTGNVLDHYIIYSGKIDSPKMTSEGVVNLGLESYHVTENKVNPTRWSNANQRMKYPDDTFFKFIDEIQTKTINWNGALLEPKPRVASEVIYSIRK